MKRSESFVLSDRKFVIVLPQSFILQFYRCPDDLNQGFYEAQGDGDSRPTGMEESHKQPADTTSLLNQGFLADESQPGCSDNMCSTDASWWVSYFLMQDSLYYVPLLIKFKFK